MQWASPGFARLLPMINALIYQDGDNNEVVTNALELKLLHQSWPSKDYSGETDLYG